MWVKLLNTSTNLNVVLKLSYDLCHHRQINNHTLKAHTSGYLKPDAAQDTILCWAPFTTSKGNSLIELATKQIHWILIAVYCTKLGLWFQLAR